MSEFPCTFQSSMVYQKSLISWFQPPAVNNCTLVPTVYTIHQEGPTPKDLTPVTRFHYLRRNPDKHTWKWKTTGRSCRKKDAFTSTSMILHIICATGHCFSTMAQMESKGVQTSCWPWSTAAQVHCKERENKMGRWWSKLQGKPRICQYSYPLQ